MHYGKINRNDIANGPGVRVSIFVSGCEKKCKGCFNEETWDFSYGKEYDSRTVEEIRQAMKHDHIEGLTVLGGEPLHPRNVAAIQELIRFVKKDFPDKTVWIYTGYTLEELAERLKHPTGMDGFFLKSLLRMTDVLVDGPFVEELKDITLRFRGSHNQRITEYPYLEIQKEAG